MRTPSLRRRVITAALGVFVLVTVGLEMFVYVSLRQALDSSLDELLEARVDVARDVARAENSADIADRLTLLGIPAVVTLATGEVVVNLPEVPRFAPGPPGPPDAASGPWKSRMVAIPDGGHIEVLATTAGVELTMRGVLLRMSIGTIVAVGLGWLALRWAASTALAPLTEVAAAARRTTAGDAGLRLNADQPGTELGRLAVAYDDMLEALEAAINASVESEARTRRFVDDAAHQLRTPVASIRASAESLLSVANPADRDRMMSNLLRETSRASRLLRDLLLIARLDAGQRADHLQTDVAALVEDEVDRARSLAPELRVTHRIVRGRMGTVVLDRAAFQEVLANLLDNARRHARDRIHVDVRIESARLWARVDDDGPGVPVEAYERVFERFTALDGRGGSGLGLSIARALIARDGGSLRCDGNGFEFWLPLAPGSDLTRQDDEVRGPRPGDQTSV